MGWNVAKLLGVSSGPKQAQAPSQNLVDLTHNAIGVIRQAKTPEEARGALELYQRLAGREARALLPAQPQPANDPLAPEPALKQVQRAVASRLQQLDRERRGFSPEDRYEPTE